MSTTENDAINEAIEEAGVEESKETTATEESTTQDESSSEPTEEDESSTTETEESPDKPKEGEVEPIEFSEKQLNEAKEIYAALNDPNRGPVVAKFLAEQAGFKIDTSEPKKEEPVEEVKEDSVESLITESLGPKYSFLAPKIAPGIERAVKLVVERETRVLKDTVTSDQTVRVKQELSSAKDTLYENYPEANKLDSEMGDVIRSQSVGKLDTETWYDYFEKVMFVAAGKKGRSVKKNSVVRFNKDKVNRNRNDAASRLASGDVSNANRSEASKEKAQTLNDIIHEAMSEVGLEE